jgi:hypothetical protein
VTTQTNKTVREKIDTMLNLQAQILIQNKYIVVPDAMLVLYLMMSMDDAYETTIEILNSTQSELTLAHKQKQLQSKESELADVERG